MATVLGEQKKLLWIAEVSLAIREMSFQNAATNAETINEFAEAIRLMSRMSDTFIKNNKDYFDILLNKAKKINAQYV